MKLFVLCIVENVLLDIQLLLLTTLLRLIILNEFACRRMGTSYGECTYDKLEREPHWPSGKLRISITGVGGFIPSNIARRLKSEGHYIIASDWNKNEHMMEDMFCHKFHLVDLSVMDNCEGDKWS